MSSDSDQLIAGRYRIEAQVGRGGMSTVYRARDETLGRLVALKVLTATDDALALARERNEIRLLASMSHHGLVTLFDAMAAEVHGKRRTVLVMEYIDGTDLAERLKKGPVAPTQVALMAKSLADALGVIHGAGIVHRDIKPGNVLLAPPTVHGEEFEAKLADLGIARLIDAGSTVTAGLVVGTAAYISPERLTGAAARPSSDIYSLGLVLLESLTGERAFPGPTAEALQSRLWRDPEVPGSLGYAWKSLLTAMTARDLESRPTASELSAATAAMIAGEEQADVSTAQLDEQLPATRVFDSRSASVSTDPQATELIDSAALVAPRERRRRARVLVPAVLVAALVAAGVVVGVGSVGGQLGGADPAVGSVPTPSGTPVVQSDPPVTPTAVPVEVEKPDPGRGNGNGNGKQKNK
jgi:serine/threonine protein kinase